MKRNTKIWIAVISAHTLFGAIYCYFNPEFRLGFKKERDEQFRQVFRPGFIKSCQHGDLSPRRKEVCECCADEIFVQFTVEELKTWTSPDKVDQTRTDKIVRACMDKVPDPIGDAAAGFAEMGRRSSEASVVTVPEPLSAPQPKPAKKPLTLIHLKNGQVFECLVLKKDASGIVVEIGGAEMSFSNAEIAQMETASS